MQDRLSTMGLLYVLSTFQISGSQSAKLCLTALGILELA